MWDKCCSSHANGNFYMNKKKKTNYHSFENENAKNDVIQLKFSVRLFCVQNAFNFIHLVRSLSLILIKNCTRWRYHGIRWRNINESFAKVGKKKNCVPCQCSIASSLNGVRLTTIFRFYRWMAMTAHADCF